MKILALILMLSSISVFAQYDVDTTEQEEPKKNNNFLKELKENIFVGSAANLRLGGVSYVYLSPQIGYDLAPMFSMGLQGIYQYIGYRTSSGIVSINSFGAGLFARFRPIEPLFIETSYNLYKTNDINTFERINVDSWMIGLGYARQIGDKAFSSVSIHHNLLYDYNVPEPNIPFVLKNKVEFIYFKFGIVLYPFN